MWLLLPFPIKKTVFGVKAVHLNFHLHIGLPRACLFFLFRVPNCIPSLQIFFSRDNLEHFRKYWIYVEIFNFESCQLLKNIRKPTDIIKNTILTQFQKVLKAVFTRAELEKPISKIHPKSFSQKIVLYYQLGYQSFSSLWVQIFSILFRFFFLSPMPDW